MHRFVIGAFVVASVPLVLAGLHQLYLLLRGGSLAPASPVRPLAPASPGRRPS